MIIKIPEYALEADLNDNEKVLAALMLFLSRAEGKAHRYQFFSEDVKYILGHLKTINGGTTVQEYGLNGAGKLLAKIKKVFDISVLNYHTWGIEFPSKLDAKYKYGNGWIKEAQVQITEPYAVKTYCYLVGRVSNGTIVSNETKLYDMYDRKQKALHPFFNDTFSLV